MKASGLLICAMDRVNKAFMLSIITKSITFKTRINRTKYKQNTLDPGFQIYLMVLVPYAVFSKTRKRSNLVKISRQVTKAPLQKENVTVKASLISHAEVNMKVNFKMII